MKQRRRYIVNPHFQWAFILRIIGMASVILAVFYLAHSVFFWRMTEQGAALGLPPEHPFFLFLESARGLMARLFFVTAAVIVGFIVMAGAMLSNRIAGPLYRLNQHMKAVARGEIDGPVSFRKHDYFQELADSFNDVIKKRSTVSDLRKSSGF